MVIRYVQNKQLASATREPLGIWYSRLPLKDVTRDITGEGSSEAVTELLKAWDLLNLVKPVLPRMT